MAEPVYGNVQFVNNSEREFFEEARLGINVRDFLNGDIGRYLHGRAKLEIEEAKHEILHLNPYDVEDQRKIVRMQYQSACGEAFMRWCADAIQNGELAEQSLKEYEQ